MLHAAPECFAGAESVMSAMDQLDELIASVKERSEALLKVHLQVKELFENSEKRIRTNDELLAALQRVRAQVGKADDIALAAVKPDLDKLKELMQSADQASPVDATISSPLLPSEVVLRAKEVLRERGRPMRRGELVRALRDRGAVLAGKDANKNLGTILWRHPNDFIPLSLGYWVRGEPLAGVYDPEVEQRKDEEAAYARYRDIRFEAQKIAADHTAQSATERAVLGLEQRRLEERYPSFPDRWQADPFS